MAIEGDFVWHGDPELVLNLKPIPRKLGPATIVLQLLSGIVRLQARPQSLYAAFRADTCLPAGRLKPTALSSQGAVSCLWCRSALPGCQV